MVTQDRRTGYQIIGPIDDVAGPGAAGEVLTSGGAGVPPTWAAVATTKEFWVPVTHGTDMSNYGEYPVARCDTDGDKGYISFFAPADYVSIDEAVIAIIARYTGDPANVEIISDYGAVGEQYNVHSETDGAFPLDLDNGEHLEVDISGILSNLAVGDRVGVSIRPTHDLIDFDVLGVRFKYA